MQSDYTEQTRTRARTSTASRLQALDTTAQQDIEKQVSNDLKKKTKTNRTMFKNDSN